MKEDIISVIVPIYNAEKHLRRCIDSILSQTYKNLEIILVNDGSLDDSKNICYDYRKKDNRIKVIDKDNKGVSNSRNTGLRAATGKYIFFIDCDDFIDYDAIEKLFLESEKYNITKLNYKIISNNREKDKTKFLGVFSKEQFLREILVGKIGGFCWGYLIERDLLLDITFDENTSYMEDNIFIVQVLNKIKNVKIVDAYYNYCINTNSLTNSNSTNNEKIIMEYIYSMNNIQQYIFDNFNYNCKEDIITKKSIIFEKEIAKISNKEQFTQIANNEEIIKNLCEILSFRKGIKILYAKLVINKRYILYRIYLFIRKILKYIKNVL